MTFPPLPEPYTLAQRAASKLARTLPGDDLTPIIEALQEYIAPVLAERDALREQVRVLREALSDAADSIESWGTYAMEYFQTKHDLQGDVARARAALEATKEKP